MLRVLYTDVSGGWGTFGPVGTGNLFLHAGNQGPNRHVTGQDDQYWTLHAELGDKSSRSNNSNNNNQYLIIKKSGFFPKCYTVKMLQYKPSLV